MTAPTLASERTALAWRRTSLGAAGCALLFAHEVTADGWPTLALPLVAAAAALLLSLLGWSRGRSLHQGRVTAGARLVAITTTAVAVMALIAVGGVVLDRLTG
ncbi:hypothetical protein NN3_45020 [Nocardia neocaledoniensis NBRC 108232]|uniref:DUF202 domain-containing protein n=1 Tax=Nocardia neocaledoniensis TaxID=236511 RepID=UPI001196FC1E|nr:DUF202 domain-containing protein [Nocardia neocaledoniensis]GEM33495.1 hypothetical protein NN3_45020 [Nocardia neocaledoniensis NBRC 108232]